MFERKTLIDGITYLLRGLPNELSPQEREQLRSSLPFDLVDGPGIALSINRRPSLLYRLTNVAVMNTIIMLSLILPYLILLVRVGASLERRYRVSETVAGYGAVMVNTVARTGFTIGDAVWKGHGGRIGPSLLGCLVWTVEEVSRGVTDGVDRGLSGVKITARG